ncbi:MAG: Glutamate 5-kinase [Firmicutes bacterium ADurb.Bin193]|nr:MAG: Glutamate 5-kinase [Firmicutes bacterium ADurb.Bin193]
MDIKKIVVKVGTSTLTHESGLMNLRRIELLSRTIADIKNSGVKVILVSSGAISVGMGKLNFDKRPDKVDEKQALAAIGQVELMDLYSTMFGEYGVSVAQLLLTKDVLDGGERQKNALATLETLLKFGVVPIINENDTISTDEIEFGDNDTLSAYVATLVSADLLIILTDTEGLYNCDPNGNTCARLIGRVEKIDDNLRALAGGSATARGTGGMITKFDAAEIAMKAGISTVIANGENPNILYDIVEGKPRGTFFYGGEKK